jgi:DNA mismatch endonuclease (patch repair protein)
MVDRLSVESRSRIMRAIRSQHTKPEMEVRRRIFAAGYRYRLHVKKLPGTPDIVFVSRKQVIFVHGCFWHQHPDPNCPIRVSPTSNRKYWLPKLRRNTERDAEHGKALRKLGWNVLIIWECELRNPSKIYARIERFLGSSRASAFIRSKK